MAFNPTIPLYRVHMPMAVYQDLEPLIAQGQLATGPLVSAFEAGLGAFLGNPRTLATGDISSSISLCLMLAGVGPGDEVVSSPMVCLATSCPVANRFARVKWCDIDPETGNLDPQALERVITGRTKAVLVYHWAGNPADLSAIQSIARNYNVSIIEDAGEALGASSCGSLIGNSGSDYTVFSFYPNRHITTIEGGAISFARNAEFEKARWLRRYGIHLPTFRLPNGEINPASDIPVAGLNTTMNQVGASIGLKQLECLPSIIARHQSNGDFYDTRFSGLEKVSSLKLPLNSHSARWVYTLLVEDRDALMGYLEGKGIQSSGLHLRNDSYSCFGDSDEQLPGVDAFSRRALSIPCGWWVDREGAEYIANSIEEFYK